MRNILIIIIAMMLYHSVSAQTLGEVNEFKRIDIPPINKYNVIYNQPVLTDYGVKIYGIYLKLGQLKSLMDRMVDSSYKQNKVQSDSIKVLNNSLTSLIKSIHTLNEEKADKKTLNDSIASIRNQIIVLSNLISEQIKREKYKRDSTYFESILQKKVDIASFNNNFETLLKKIDSCCKMKPANVTHVTNFKDSLNLYFNFKNEQLEFIKILNKEISAIQTNIMNINYQDSSQIILNLKVDSILKVHSPMIIRNSDSLNELKIIVTQLKDTIQAKNLLGVIYHSSTEIGFSYWRYFKNTVLGIETWNNIQDFNLKNMLGIRICGGYLFNDKILPSFGIDYFTKLDVNNNVKPSITERSNKYGINFGISIKTKNITTGIFYSSISLAGLRLQYNW